MSPKYSTILSKAILTLTGVALASFGATLSARPRLQTGPDAEMSYDGLHLVDKAVMDMTWVKPDLDLAGYTQIMLVGAGMAFTPVDNAGQRYWPGRSNDTEFPISDESKLRLR